MDPQTKQANYLKKLSYLVLVLVLIVSLYLLVSAFKDYQNSGVLIAESPDSKALLSISQANHQAKFIGQGKAKVRLPAGDYEVASSYNGGQALTVAEVKKGQSSKIALPKNKVSVLPSVLSIDFQNLSSLTDSGLSATQAAELQQYFFKFKKNTSNVAIDGSSIKPGPHNPDTDIGFSTLFIVKVDTSQYKAIVTYIGLDDIRLKLYDMSGSLAFDSGV